MRILRAILLGQIPVVTKQFHDHIVEDVATLWDGKVETAVELGTRQFIDRRMWLTDYVKSLEAYDQQATTANKPFVSAVKALTESMSGSASLPKALEAPTPFATTSRARERR